MARKREEVSNEEFVSLQDVLCSFNNSISEEQAWAVCYQCAQYFEQNSSQDGYRDLYYYGITAIRLSKEGDVKIDVNFNQGTGKGPPRKRSSFSLSKEFKTVITPTDVRQALGTAIYKALDYGLSESEEPHLSSELEALIESLTDDQPTDDDEGIDIERDSDQDIDDNQGREQSEFCVIIDSCTRRLSSQQNAQLHYKAVCRALATEAEELVTFLDNIAKGHKKLQSTSDNRQPSVDDLERSDWARLWVQIMRQLRHGVRLKKVEQVHLPPVEFELTPFEILLEDIRLGRYKLNRIMVNGDIPKKVKDDAHAVILDFIRSRPPLKPVNRRQLKELPQREMEPRELLLHDICKPHNLKPVKHGKLVVRKPTDCDTNYSSDEESPKPVRKVIKPVAAFQVSTDDSDSYFSDPDDDYHNHISAPVMSPLDPVYPDADDVTWKRAVAKDLVRQSSSNCRSVARRHTISACDVKSGTKVSQPSQHASLPEDEEDFIMHNKQFNRGHAARKATQIISYRKKHKDLQHANCGSQQTVTAQNYVNNQPKFPQKHVGHCLLSKSHGNIVDNVFSVPSNVHEMSCGEISRLSRSASVASISGPRRCKSPSNHAGQSHSSRTHAGRSESPVRHLSRSETFTCSVPRKAHVSSRNDTHISTRCDSPQTRAMKHSDSFPPPRSGSPIQSHRTESPRRHSVHVLRNSNDSACDTQTSNQKVRRRSVQHAHGFVSRSSHNLQNSHLLQRHASFAGTCLSRVKHESSSQKQAWSETHQHGNRSSSQSPTRERLQGDTVDSNLKTVSNSLSKSENNESVQSQKASYPQDKMADGDGKTVDMKPESVTLRRSKTTIVRARSRPDVRSKELKEKEEKHFQLIERAGLSSKTVSKNNHDRVRPVSEIDFSQKTRSQVSRPKSYVERSIVSRSVDSRIPVKSDTDVTNKDSTETKSDQNESMPKRAVRLSRQSAIKTEGSEIRSKLQSKTTRESVGENRESDSDIQSGLSKAENKPRDSRARRVGVVANEKFSTNESASDIVDSAAKREETKQEVTKQEVTSDCDKFSSRHRFRQVKPILRSRSEVRPEMKPVKGSHNLPVDFEHNNLDHLEYRHLIIPPPEFRDPEDTTPTNELSNMHDDIENGGNIPDIIKTSRAEFKVVDLLHVSWKTECPRQDPTNKSNPCSDCRPLPSHKWQNPIECLSLTLEEVTHIRSVLTKAELESLITNPELHSQVSKGKICFTCKKTKFSLFGQWGTKCKFCQRTICNYCLRKMSVPTEHFEKIPVYTLSPVPLSPEVLEALKVYESTGSVPHSPITNRKIIDSDSNNKAMEEPVTPVADENKAASKRKSLQRSHTIGVGVGSRPPPNKALLKGPQMSICCDCKSMIMEIIRASRSSVSLITGKPEAQEGDKDKDSLTPRGQVSARSSVVMRPRHLDLQERPRPRSMLDNFSFKSFNFSKTSTDA